MGTGGVAEPAVEGRLPSLPRVLDRLRLNSPPKGDLLDFFTVEGVGDSGLPVGLGVDGGTESFSFCTRAESAEVGVPLFRIFGEEARGRTVDSCISAMDLCTSRIITHKVDGLHQVSAGDQHALRAADPRRLADLPERTFDERTGRSQP